MSKPHVLMTGLVIGESPRWHDGRLWFANWGAQEIIAVEGTGRSELIARVPTTILFSIDWLPDGRLLVVSGTEARLLRLAPDGAFVEHVDTSGLAVSNLNEIVVDGRGNIYLNGGCEFDPSAREAPGIIALVTPEGKARQVADQIAFPNGMAVTADNSTLIIAESFAGRLTAFDIAADGSLLNRRVWADVFSDGICIDAEGAVWGPSWRDGRPGCIRVDEGGQVRQWIETDRACFACMLGGEAGTTLFMLAADWHMNDGFANNLNRLTTGPRTGQLLVADVSVPGAGWP
jgi:sugar lactone lactonase YvrE